MMTKLILGAVLVLQVCWAAPNGMSGRITDGQDAVPGQFPYQVSIQWGLPLLTGYSHICGGSIISETFVLTAGHCVIKFGKTRIVAGKYFFNRNEVSDQTIGVIQGIVHSGYKGGIAQHDIALLKLAGPLEFNEKVAPIKLPKQGEVQTGNAVISGWGSISKQNIPVLPGVLQMATVPILSNTECYKELTSEAVAGQQPELFDTQVCSGSAGKEISACSGDSGGPLAQGNGTSAVQVGIVSWGMMPCGSDHMPSVYTRVSSYVDWINENMS